MTVSELSVLENDTNITNVDVQSSGGFVCRRVADEHGLQTIAELQASVDPLVFGRADYFTDDPLHSGIRHSDRYRGHQPVKEAF